ncbi:hypothetical protein UFOVP383_56 [uncultured Caudovirales phage]|uniref:Uncharacterized protein n=1 Tax=uncultured Caudovirales phage TaxID=2100421 RepID=A0A6J7X2U3_9CAUD|nr:hypothetical protein UFOVP383_56 [uncultured Caudovirales phage]
MTDKSFPITPPPELVQQWVTKACPECRLTYDEFTGESVQSLATAAAQWGADQELEACCEWLVNKLTFREDGIRFAGELRVARRPTPKPPETIEVDGSTYRHCPMTDYFVEVPKKVLSPAAQAVWTAYETADCDPYLVDPRKAGIAAAICALADEAIPITKTPWSSTFVPVFSAMASRERILAIATELEGQ